MAHANHSIEARRSLLDHAITVAQEGGRVAFIGFKKGTSES